VTSAFERELLTWYYTRPGMFRRGDGRPSALVTEIETKYVKAGLLRYDIRNDEIIGVEEALKVYMDALAAVPLPRRRDDWFIPR
jgi:hypothetical protein